MGHLISKANHCLKGKNRSYTLKDGEPQTSKNSMAGAGPVAWLLAPVVHAASLMAASDTGFPHTGGGAVARVVTVSASDDISMKRK